ncbi:MULTISPECIES: M23 family metallopeptidase [Nitrincola]|uniref:Glycyl-glycine endopeptidase ALE-1 n=1 Tax=Nitrincola nitratireducens TaxID=1229521 RepID=W9UQ43_9GAMM|nr:MULTISPECIES: M23 family metallopeptidase [Nitrincola]EXJ09313.1 Glycyl-glycine endopeptidase ALE-1 precursor [Nitrincola nitratireducens]
MTSQLRTYLVPFILCLLAVILFFQNINFEPTDNSSSVETEILIEEKHVTTFSVLPLSQTSAHTHPNSAWVSYPLDENTDLHEALSKAGISASDIASLLKEQSFEDIKRQHSFIERMSLVFDASTLLTLKFFSKDTEWEFIRTSDEWHVQVNNAPASPQLRRLNLEINGRLYPALRSMGLDRKIYRQLLDALDNYIDLDLLNQSPYALNLLISEQPRHLAPTEPLQLLAFEFKSETAFLQLYHHTSKHSVTGFFKADGTGLAHTFLSAPLEHARISSPFQRNRLHPLLGYARPHRGVDYAAPMNTPIYATGHGKITFRGPDGGFGNTIIIEHPKGISTLYAHMNGFAKNTQVGTPVTKGQLIGYVGMSGLATGPHLHYEFRIHGEHQNPLTAKSKDLVTIPQAERALFEQNVVKLTQLLEPSSEPLLASYKPYNEPQYP